MSIRLQRSMVTLHLPKSHRAKDTSLKATRRRLRSKILTSRTMAKVYHPCQPCRRLGDRIGLDTRARDRRGSLASHRIINVGKDRLSGIKKSERNGWTSGWGGAPACTDVIDREWRRPSTVVPLRFIIYQPVPSNLRLVPATARPAARLSLFLPSPSPRAGHRELPPPSPAAGIMGTR